jgi:hypothetical protein
MYGICTVIKINSVCIPKPHYTVGLCNEDAVIIIIIIIIIIISGVRLT